MLAEPTLEHQVTTPVSVHAPTATRVELCTGERRTALHLNGGRWIGELVAPPGTVYWLEVDGGSPLVDPDCRQVTFTADGPRCVVAAEWPRQERLGRRVTDPVIYELHVKGFGGTFGGVAERLDHLVALGVDVIELLPVAPFDTSNNYWGYMSVVWGAVHESYAAGPDPAAELAGLIGEAHRRGIAVWLDVVMNHTGEGEVTMPTWTLRGLDDRGSYVFDGDEYLNAAGTGNMVNPASPEIRRLVMTALERFAGLGVDGFRFDLAAILARDGGSLVREIAEWATRHDIDVVAEAWDLVAYMVGNPLWVAPWRQWNDRFREDVRGFWAGEPGLVSSVMRRVAGSPDLFGDTARRSTVNYVTAHDGLTMYDLVAYNAPRHRAHHEPEELRPQLIKNLFTTLLMSAGAAMFVQGDEFARTQSGHENPYNVDGPVSWVDWALVDEHADLVAYVTELIALRRRYPVEHVEFFGVHGGPDTGDTSRSLAWCTGSLFVVANPWEEALTFPLPDGGPWRLALSSLPVDGTTVAARSSAVWVRG